ncbi:MAG: helix-turn-helix domain-containing protein [Micavibrio sp.]
MTSNFEEDELGEKELGAVIAGFRKALKMTQEDLAGKADMDRSYLSEIENGHKNMSIGTLKKIARALEVNITDLLKDTFS